MLVTKILEGTLSAGQTTITFTDSAIPNSFIRVGSTNPDLFPTEQTISGNTLTIKYEAQSSALGVVVELVKAGMTINDTLTSTATDEALSANQGKALKDIIDGMGTPSIDELTNVNITDPATDDILIYDGTEEEWINTSMPNIPSDIDDLQDVVITSPSDDDVLTYDNGEWVNKPAQGGAGGTVDYDNLLLSYDYTCTSAPYDYTYTATEDCYCFFSMCAGANQDTYAQVLDGLTVITYIAAIYTGTLTQQTFWCYLSKGKTLKVHSTFNGAQLSNKVFAVA